MRVMSMLVEGTSGADSLGTGTAADLESTGRSVEPADAAAAALVAPLRALTADVMFGHELANSWTPLTCLSSACCAFVRRRARTFARPRASISTSALPPRATPHGPLMVHGHCIAYVMDPTGKLVHVEPLDKEVHQFSP